MEFQRTIPILRIFDVSKAKEFYVDTRASGSTGNIISAQTRPPIYKSLEAT